MKVQGKTSSANKFNPVTIELTFETMDEVAAVQVLFNNRKIADELLIPNGVDDDAIRACIKTELGGEDPEITKQWSTLLSLLK